MPKTRKENTPGAGRLPGYTADGGMKGKQAEDGIMRNRFGDERKRDEFTWIFANYAAA